MDNSVAIHKQVNGRTDDTDIAAADGDISRMKLLYRLRLEKLHQYTVSYVEIGFPLLFSQTFRSASTSENAGAIQMKWGNWAEILSPSSVMPLPLT